MDRLHRLSQKKLAQGMIANSADSSILTLGDAIRWIDWFVLNGKNQPQRT